MDNLKNEFSWSTTRDEVFRTCPRQYWFAYYGYWYGWLEDVPERTRQIYLLKNLKNRHAWGGEKVRACIQRTLNNIRRAIRVLPVDEIISITLDQMRSEFRSSRAKNYTKDPETCALFEHEYELEVTDDEWKKVARHVETCLRNFYASDIYDGLRSHRKEGWLEVEEFSAFSLDKTKIHLAIDCAIREGEDIFIYDWKTGPGLSESLSLQRSCYTLYAMEKYQVSPDLIRIIEFNLSSNRGLDFQVGREEAENFKGYIRGSIKDMQSLLVDTGNNIPFEEHRFSGVEDERVSLPCNFRKVCRG